MKHRETDAFRSDLERLSEQEGRLFLAAVRAMNQAAGPHPLRVPRWPASLRVKHLSGHPGVYEMTWSFSGPDDRATFDLLQEDGEVVLRWRRIGDHRIYRNP